MKNPTHTDVGPFPKPEAGLKPNTPGYEFRPLVKASGFREYDARWWFGTGPAGKPPELNLMGAQAVGMGLGTLVRRRGIRPSVITGHDYRSYSSSIKLALVSGMMAAGCEVHDIGLALSPMAYFAQFALDVPCVAMVTASHNENGWTGVKLGCDRPVTFGPEDMQELKQLVLDSDFDLVGGGSYRFHQNFAQTYIADLVARGPFRRKMKVIAACGNGTAGFVAPRILSELGCEVVPLDAELDHSFPRYNPNPEDLNMLHAMSEAVLQHRADLALGFDGDGDRCGVVDDAGAEIFADKIGFMLARDLSRVHGPSRFVVDVKSTSLFSTDEELRRLGAETEYWKTGHSYIKRRVRETNALAGFEKSGHFFFNPPIGRGYDDGLVTAIAVLGMLDRNPDKKLSELYAAIPRTWSSPTMSPHCADEVKYDVVRRVTSDLEAMYKSNEKLAGQSISSLLTVNGVRVTTGDGTWGLVRASSNKPELVVVVESPVSQQRSREMFAAIDKILRRSPEVGAYNQTF